MALFIIGLFFFSDNCIDFDSSNWNLMLHPVCFFFLITFYVKNDKTIQDVNEYLHDFLKAEFDLYKSNCHKSFFKERGN